MASPGHSSGGPIERALKAENLVLRRQTVGRGPAGPARRSRQCHGIRRPGGAQHQAPPRGRPQAAGVRLIDDLTTVEWTDRSLGGMTVIKNRVPVSAPGVARGQL
jgi:hypothetical protein